MNRDEFNQLLKAERSSVAQNQGMGVAAGSDREARWAARKQARVGGAGPAPVRASLGALPGGASFAPPTSTGVAPLQPSLVAGKPPSPAQQLSKDDLFGAPPAGPTIHNRGAATPPQPQASYTPIPKRKSQYAEEPSNAFFTNPVSDAEQKRQQMQNEYRQYAQANPPGAAQPQRPPSSRPLSQNRAAIPMIDPNKARQNEYQAALQRQMEERERKKKLSREQKVSQSADYFPFGRPGAGAPYRDQAGNIISRRPPHYNENDPNFLRASEVYAELAHQSAQQLPADMGGMQMQMQMQQAPAAPPVQQMAMYPAPPQQDFQYAPAPPQQDFQYAPGPPTEPPAAPDFYPPEPQVDIAELHRLEAKNAQQTDLQRALAEQIEEKKRRQEEDKRQRLLEERMEEARLEKERREIEEAYKRENEKRKKEMQDLQAFNEQNFVVAKKQAARRATPPPVEPPKTPPHEPPDFRQVREVKVEKIQSEIPIEITKKMQANMDNEIWKVRNEVNHQTNELRDNIVRLKEEAQLANEQRFEAQRELDRLKEDMQKRQMEEDIRNRELYNALVLQSQNPAYVEQGTHLTFQAPQEPQRKLRTENAFDPTKSLVGESKFIPLANAEGPLKPTTPNQELTQDQKKVALRLDKAFPGAPPQDIGSLSLGTANLSAASESIGIADINKRNEDRLRLLEKVENAPQDELTKLDDLLFSYLNENKDEGLSHKHSGMNAIAEQDEDMYMTKAFKEGDILIK